MLKLILIVTFCAPDLGEMERAYTNVLQYQVVDRGKVSSDLAQEWAAPKMRGHRYILLRPKSQANIYLRAVQEDAIEDYRPMSTYGWNATEILVQDPDALARRIREPGSGFQVVGEPRPLGPNSPIRALQAVGPAREVLYLTRIPPDSPTLRSARTFVDRPFILILGSSDLPRTRQFLRERFNLDSGEPGQARMTVLNKAFGLDIETTHPLTVARLSPDYSLELDQYPQSARERPQHPGALPPAQAIVSFEVESLNPFRDLLLAPPRRIEARPYDGRLAGTLRGSAGELMELIETAPRAH
jgi:hypothetical protein